MAAVSPSPLDEFSPKQPRVVITTPDLITIEEGKPTPSQASTTDIPVVSPNNAHKIIAEMVGTYVIVLIGCGSLIVDRINGPLSVVGIAVAWGLVVMVMIYTFGHISGGHFNPAITIAFAISCKYPWRQVPGYVASQLAGSTLAILTLNVMFHREKIDIKITTTQYEGRATDLESFIWEFITSFILMLTICGVAIDTKAINELSGVAVGSAMLFDMLIAGNITGASMNPARSIGPALVSKDFCGLWVYIFAPILGMIAASTMYTFLWPPTQNVDKDNSKSV
ncbi:hypothetical protein JCGZ_24027 [Jatropha curcas]|uniref:Uncharacterized protein n=1 Tax=Jatropha curcas TaxID=180498 RepID=A0A067LHI9_JATCU|nr:nodulin-26 [Jatropha curcas]KDP46818.1 hypothetical protein JCGZ_24027 [Jatropha curcas]